MAIIRSHYPGGADRSIDHFDFMLLVMGLWSCPPSFPLSLNNCATIKKLNPYHDGDSRYVADVVEIGDSSLTFTCYRLQNTWDFWPERRLYSLLSVFYFLFSFFWFNSCIKMVGKLGVFRWPRRRYLTVCCVAEI